jgi:hypothetical protein
MRMLFLPLKPPAPPPTRRRFIAALVFACAAHLGVLAFAAHRTPAAAPAPETRVAAMLLGHIEGDQGDFVADGYVRARIRAR